ncbi:hypothetical protein CFK37_17840 [Virgibacillus phasianinus]|uniref:Methyltransferase type 11 domain-containing protein n=1 Tax=Virgibacillus phasianinus TaxID=2017483 RepID=A0A220U7L7_9BACI|nr:hypothetical protein CFK37_17840 [Virgibacillus phasianinus]
MVPSPDKSFQEMIRVLKPGGKVIIFDKFKSNERGLSLPKRLIRPFVNVLGTDIGISFEDLYHKYKDQIRVEYDTPVMMKGMYRKIVVTKRS